MEIYLNTVKTELEQNRKETVELQQFYEQTWEFGQYLSGRVPDTAISIKEKFVEIISGFYPAYKTSAFDMLKSSGVMHLIQDKKILNAI